MDSWSPLVNIHTASPGLTERVNSNCSDRWGGGGQLYSAACKPNSLHLLFCNTAPHARFLIFLILPTSWSLNCLLGCKIGVVKADCYQHPRSQAAPKTSLHKLCGVAWDFEGAHGLTVNFLVSSLYKARTEQFVHMYVYVYTHECVYTA